ncbi:MAG: efflux RND transporter permease subunit [Candidatus Thiodiazotropha lotti]|uniref:Efflux RND transporter permease subunit n=1 Tax=Candidatus Thiodiazotropha lotti TaxID=2792787 RepID=A0A9E4K836_9GAMM|nr:efflux RND transporter permease subunit [Candidatus Thiodiazotropha lotti]MCW4205555.1 efflux RND transporter permease subunit [Candidatus Thiodiazotropha lotti]ODC01806.1 acriflavin resistance protein [Candidatus Thiodiazotropha endoloripes]
MNTLIDLAFSRSRAVLLSLLFILVAGAMAYNGIPKESEPDIAVPIIYVSMSHDGISPEDAERLLVRPMEKELQSIAGLKEMKSTAGEGHASVQLEFSAGFDSKQALTDVREKVDIAKVKLPDATDEPEVVEVNVALFPVLTVSLSGPIPERSLVTIARDLQDRIEALPGVLEAVIGGDREAVLEVIVDPAIMETYGVEYDELISMVTSNNRLVAAGAMDTGAGRLVLKVPGVIEELDDVLRMPVKVDGDRVITFGEVASIRRSFKDPESFARVDGQPALTLEVKKRVGANIIDTITEVRSVVEAERKHWPTGLNVSYMQDKSDQIREMLSDLQNNILSAIILVMIVIIAALGPRSAVLVGLAIPGSFLAAMLVLDSMGFTLNIVVLFSLILVVGMLVDGAIVVIEMADRKMQQGNAPMNAYAAAAKRMSWPITASTLTTLAVFAPLLFWPGLVGEFMKYLPITVIIALTASLAMALVFVPVLGGTISRREQTTETVVEGSFTQRYAKLLAKLLHHPGKTLGVALLAMFIAYLSYMQFGKGMEFFPDVEPEFAQIQVHARGDLSVHEKDAIVRQVEQRVLDFPELDSVYARSFNSAQGQNMAEDVVGVIQLEFIDWDQRRPAAEILEEMRQRTQDIPGIQIEFRKAENGPSGGKPIQIELGSREFKRVAKVVSQLRGLMAEQGGYIDIEDDRPLPGIDWRLEVDRELAARYGASVSMLGSAVQMITTGIKVTEYRPDDTDDEVDIRIRFPYSERNLGQLDQLKVSTVKGMVPISNFVTLQPAAKSGNLRRVDAQRVITIQADVEEGLLPDNQLKGLQQLIADADPDAMVKISFKGEDEDQREAMTFLMGAFISAIFLMALILVIQFNSIYQAFLVLSAIVFSTAGVLLGLLITAQPFGVVMVGLGIIALAGIVVNNNIVLIDTYNRLRREGLDSFNAALTTGRRRLRPVFLTAFTTVLGLMPMVLAMNIDLIHRSISFGAPSTQWWTQLASAIAGGLSFATLLTLILTPCLLVLGESVSVRVSAGIGKLSGRQLVEPKSP